MKLKNILLSILFLTSLSSVWAAEVGEQSKETTTILGINDDYITHTVTSGDTVYSLARKYNTTVEEIYKLNPESKNGIRNGQLLKVPKSKSANANDNTPAGSSSYGEHVVQKGETLYGISKAEEATIETIYNLNSELKISGLKVGMVLKVPLKRKASIHTVPMQPLRNASVAPPVSAPEASYIEHKIKKGETLYSLSKTYNVGVDAILISNPHLKTEGLRIGKKLRIPSPVIESAPAIATGNTILTGRIINASEPIKIGVFLPFLDDKSSVQKEKLVEYYEGFLLSVKALKEAGINAEIYTFDTGAEKDVKRLRNILETSEVNNLHLVIGGTSQEHINLLTDFSQKTGIRYVIPFGVKKSVLQNSPNVFQITTSHSSLYPNITKAFVDKFRNDNIIFVSELGSDNNKKDFVTALKKVLTQENIPFKDLTPGDKIVDNMKAAVSASKANVFIPTSSSEVSLRKIAGVLDMVPNESITLFGYPEWQTYLHLSAQLYKYNTCIYSSFYLDESNGKAQATMADYRKWYNKTIALSFPKFAFLGYDTGLYFITELNKYRNRFEAEIPYIKSPTLQSAVYFTKENENSGYLNSGFYFVNFKKDSTIEKIEYK